MSDNKKPTQSLNKEAKEYVPTKNRKLNNKNNLLINYNNNTSMNITNLRKNLPNIITSLTPIEKRNKYTKTLMISKNKKNNGNNNKGLSLSRNFGNNSLNKYNTENSFKSKIIRKTKKIKKQIIK